MWLVDPQDDFRDHLGDPLPPRVLYQQVESRRMQLDPGLRFDLIMIDGDHEQPAPTQDVLAVLPHCHEHTLLWLDDYDPARWPGMEALPYRKDAPSAAELCAAVPPPSARTARSSWPPSLPPSTTGPPAEGWAPRA